MLSMKTHQRTLDIPYHGECGNVCVFCSDSANKYKKISVIILNSDRLRLINVIHNNKQPLLNAVQCKC